MKTQADGVKKMMQREEFIQKMQEKGWEVRVNDKGMFGIRRGKNSDKKVCQKKSVFIPTKTIKGEKAYYSVEYFCAVGGVIYDRKSNIEVDVVSA